MTYELKEYSFGDTIGKTFNIYFDNFLVLFLLSLALYSVPILLSLQYLNSYDVMDPYAQILSPLYWFQILSNILLQVILQMVVIKLVSQKILNPATKDLSYTGFWKDIIGNIIPILVISFLIGLTIVGGVILLIVPAIIFGVGFSLSINVRMMEKTGIIESMKRSWFLTKKNKLNVFLLFLLVGMIVGSISYMITMVAMVPAMIDLFTNAAAGEFNMNEYMSSLTPSMAIGYLSQATLAPIMPSLATVIYFNLRIQKEGFNVEHLVSQFGDQQTEKKPIE
jgi:hypothetical protein